MIVEGPRFQRRPNFEVERNDRRVKSSRIGSVKDHRWSKSMSKRGAHALTHQSIYRTFFSKSGERFDAKLLEDLATSAL